MSEERRRQLNTLLDELWGRDGACTTVVPFPRPKKPGAKVRRGPCAEILRFPAQLSGDELDCQYSWLRNNCSKWENDEVEGPEEKVEEPSEACRLLMVQMRQKFGWAEPTEAVKRQRVADWRKLIEKRNSVKDWLESLGADLDSFGKLNPAEQALFFVFDRMCVRKSPFIA